MKVVILCGGLGMRLREETEVRPKPMVEIGGRPILWHIMKTYAHFGFKDFVLCLGYKGEIVKEYFYHYELFKNDFTIALGDHKSLQIHGGHGERDWRVTLADTGDGTLKGARIKQVEQYVDGDAFLLTYGDGLARIDLADLVAFHRRHGKMATVTGVRPPSRFGELVVQQGRAVAFTEKPQVSQGFINGGYFVLNRGIFDLLTIDPACDFERGPLEQLAADGELMVYEHTAEWECMDTLRDVVHLNKLWSEGKAFWKVWG